MKHHEIQSRVREITGLTAFDESSAVSVLVLGDNPAMVPVVRGKLAAAGLTFSEEAGRKFKGCKFIVALRNVGTAFHANWEFA